MTNNVEKLLHLPTSKFAMDGENEYPSSFSIGHDITEDGRFLVLLSEYVLKHDGGKSGTEDYWLVVAEHRIDPIIASELGIRLSRQAQSFIAANLLGYNPYQSSEDDSVDNQ